MKSSQASQCASPSATPKFRGKIFIFTLLSFSAAFANASDSVYSSLYKAKGNEGSLMHEAAKKQARNFDLFDDEELT